MTRSFPPHVTLSLRQREALRHHYLVTLRREDLQPKGFEWYWRCSCREANGVDKDKHMARYWFGRHLEDVKHAHA